MHLILLTFYVIGLKFVEVRVTRPLSKVKGVTVHA